MDTATPLKAHVFLSVLLLLFSSSSFSQVNAAEPSHVLHQVGSIAHMVRPDPSEVHKHEDWHKRKSIDLPTLHLPSTSDPPAIASATPRSSDTSRPTSSHVGPTSTSSTASSALPIPSLRPSISANAAASHDKAIDIERRSACMAALPLARRSTTSRSGLVPCYSILSLNSSIGTFAAHLRIYRIRPAQPPWTAVDSTMLSIGLLYAHATVTQQQPAKQKREVYEDDDDEEDDDDDDAYVASSSGDQPQKIGSLRLLGQVEEDVLAALSDWYITPHAIPFRLPLGRANDSRDAARMILMPQARVSATSSDGTIISEGLGEGAWFVSGVFAQRAEDVSRADVHRPIDVQALLAEGIGLEGRQLVPVLLAGAWAFLLTMAVARGVLLRRRVGMEYRKKLAEGWESGLIVITWN